MPTITALLIELCDAFNAHDLDHIMSLFHDDCVLEMPRGSNPWGSRHAGKQSVRAALATRFAGLPDVHYANAEHFADEATGVGVSRWTLTGTPHSGPAIRVQGCDIYTFEDGKVARKDSYWKIIDQLSP